MRVAGILGVVGGGVLLAAFLPSLVIPADVNNGRLLLYFLGAGAVSWATLRAGMLGPGTRAAVAAGAIIVLSAVSALIVVIASTRQPPFAGEFGLVAFWIGLATWIASSVFGLLLVRRPAPVGLGGIALAVGSALAILGMDRLGLTSSTNPTVLGPVALVGVALDGLGWVLLGLALVVAPPRPVIQAKA